MDRRRAALYALIVFAVASAVAIVISGSRPAGQQGALPEVVQGVGYVFAVLAAAELLLPAAHPAGADRKLGGVLLAAVAVMIALDVFGGGGSDIGAGFLRLMCLVVTVGIAARLLTTALASGRSR